MQKELKKNDEIIVKIERLGVNGEGIASVDSKIIFVPYSLPNEVVKVHIINDKKSFLIGKAIEIIEKSIERVDAPCPYFEKCGGCDIQHISYENQLNFKTKLVKDTLEKYTGVKFEVNNIISSENNFHYRNKFAFPVQEQNGQVKIGMFRKNSHNIVEIDDCLLQSKNTKLILKLFKDYMIENNISAFNEQTNKGDIKHIVVRENENSFLMTVVVTNKNFNNFEPLVQKLNKHFTNYGIIKNVNLLNNNVIFGNLDIFVYGNKELEFNELGVRYFVSNKSFLQVNSNVKTKIYNAIIEEIGQNSLVIDAYSGAGLLSSILAKHTKKVIGVEIVKEATKNADNLKLINGLDNLININGDCTKIIPELAKNISEDFVVVIDPPRKGIEKTVAVALCNAKPNKIIYLSCNPATLARDLTYFLHDYSVKFIQPFDMFPQTSNVETLVCLVIN